MIWDGREKEYYIGSNGHMDPYHEELNEHRDHKQLNYRIVSDTIV